MEHNSGIGLHHTHSSHASSHKLGQPAHGSHGTLPSYGVPVHVPVSPDNHVHDHPPKLTVMQKLARKASRTLRRVPNVPGLLAVALCSVAFWFGRVSISTALLPEPAGPINDPKVVGAARVSQRLGRTLQEKGSEVRLIGAGSKLSAKSAENATVLAPTIDPYDIEAFEAAVSKGLSALKPPMTPGESGEAFYRTIPFQILSWYPRIMVFPNFVDKARRDEVIAAASKMLYPSGLAYRPGEKVEAEQQVRTSQGTFLSPDAAPALRWLEDKIAAATFLPAGNGEFWNVLNYKHSQHYDSHMDSFDPKEYGPQYSQRIATIIVVLSDEGLVGGETVFKREGKPNANKPISNWTDCDADGGLKYKPRAGDAVLFWSALPDGTLDPHALHGSCPVVTGDKWVAVKWVRNKGSYNN